jgi:hypothetical protein
MKGNGGVRYTSQQFFSLSYVHPPHPQPLITRHHPSGIGPGKPIITVPFGTPTPAPSVLRLDWDCDPRLVYTLHILSLDILDIIFLHFFHLELRSQ